MARTQWNAFACTPLASHHLTERHTYIHACMHRDENDKNDDDDDDDFDDDALFLPPTESTDEHLGGGDRGGDGGGRSSDCRVDVDAAASLMLRVDS